MTKPFSSLCAALLAATLALPAVAETTTTQTEKTT